MPHNIKLFRYYYKDATLGILRINDDHEPIFTLEPIMQDQYRDLSCIQAGTYPIRFHNTGDNKHVYKIISVPGRIGIFLKAGSYLKDTSGSILPGISLNSMSGVNTRVPMVCNSVRAMDMIHDLLRKNEATIQIINL